MNSYGNFETPKKGLSGGLKAIVAVIIIVGIIANAFGAIIIGGIVAAIMQIFAPVTVFDAGLYALYNALPQTVIFETLLYSDVIVDIDGELRGDVFPTIGDDAAVNLDGSIYYSYYDGAAEGKLYFGSDNEQFWGKCYLDRDGAVFESELLGNDLYGVSFEDFDGAFSDSLFAPDGGSDYAVSAEAAVILRNLVAVLDSDYESKEIFSDAIKRIYKAVKGDISVTEFSESRSENVVISATEYAFDAEFIPRLCDAIADELKGNEEFAGIIRKAVSDYRIAVGNGNTSDPIDGILDYLSKISSSESEIVFRYRMNGNVLEKLEFIFSAEAENKALADIKVEFSYDDSLKLNASVFIEGLTTSRSTVSLYVAEPVIVSEGESVYQENNVSLAWNMNFRDVKFYGNFDGTGDNLGGNMTFSVYNTETESFEGFILYLTLLLEEEQLGLNIDGLEIIGGAEILESKLRITVCPRDYYYYSVIHPYAEEERELLSLSADEVEGIRSYAYSVIESRAEEINSNLGGSLFVYDSICSEPETVYTFPEGEKYLGCVRTGGKFYILTVIKPDDNFELGSTILYEMNADGSFSKVNEFGIAAAEYCIFGERIALSLGSVVNYVHSEKKSWLYIYDMKSGEELDIIKTGIYRGILPFSYEGYLYYPCTNVGDKNHVIKYDHESGELITLEYDVAYNNYPVTYVAFDEAKGILATVTNIKGNYDVELSYIKFFDINNGFREVASYKTEPVESGITLRDGVFYCDKDRFESSEGTRLDDAELGLQDGEYIVSYNTDSFVKYDIGTYVLCTRYGAEAYTFDGVCGYVFSRGDGKLWAVCRADNGRAYIAEYQVSESGKISVRTAFE